MCRRVCLWPAVDSVTSDPADGSPPCGGDVVGSGAGGKQASELVCISSIWPSKEFSSRVSSSMDLERVMGVGYGVGGFKCRERVEWGKGAGGVSRWGGVVVLKGGVMGVKGNG